MEVAGRRPAGAEQQTLSGRAHAEEEKGHCRDRYRAVVAEADAEAGQLGLVSLESLMW